MNDISGSLGFEPFLNFSTRMREVLEEKGAAILKAFEETCEKAGVNKEIQMSVGVVAGEICEKAKVADLVVMGRRGLNAKFSTSFRAPPRKRS
jgi:nucleotide-binding universal stress UspA family protein